MAVWKLAPALAAGCPVVLKTDPQTPASALRIAQLAADAGFPAGAINVISADGPTTGAYLVRHPGVDKVAFTGSTRTGVEIMKLAAESIKRVTLELGGKSPNLIFADANLADAIPSSAWAVFYACGQSCEARSRLLVEKSIYDDVVTRFAEAAAKIKQGDPLEGDTQIGSLISLAHRERVNGFVERALAAGGEAVTGGSLPSGPGAFYPPTVVAGLDNSAEIAQEEVFGPVVTIIPFEDEADAIRIANDIAYGLSSYVWTENIGKAHRVAAAVEAGMCFVNSQNVRDLRQPFGGTKASGTGREGGTWSYEVFLEPKNVAVSLGGHHIPHWGV
jgi:5-carboxymethyl-2-hydroxymuconic-semialdehyde dehydrogenase